MLCQNVYRPHCGRVATRTVPMFMGTVWMCPQCSLEIQGSDDDICEPEIRTGDYVRVPDIGVCGIVAFAENGHYTVEYFDPVSAESGIATCTRYGIVPV